LSLQAEFALLPAWCIDKGNNGVMAKASGAKIAVMKRRNFKIIILMHLRGIGLLFILLMFPDNPHQHWQQFMQC